MGIAHHLDFIVPSNSTSSSWGRNRLVEYFLVDEGLGTSCQKIIRRWKIRRRLAKRKADIWRCAASYPQECERNQQEQVAIEGGTRSFLGRLDFPKIGDQERFARIFVKKRSFTDCSFFYDFGKKKLQYCIFWWLLRANQVKDFVFFDGFGSKTVMALKDCTCLGWLKDLKDFVLFDFGKE